MSLHLIRFLEKTKFFRTKWMFWITGREVGKKKSPHKLPNQEKNPELYLLLKKRPRITRQDSCNSKSPFKYNLHTGCEVIFISNNSWASWIGPLFHDYMGNIDCEEVMTWKAEWNNHERFWKQLTGTVTSKASHLQSQPSPPSPNHRTQTHTTCIY